MQNYEIIKDGTKFKELSTDPIITKQVQRQRFLRSMIDKQVFTKETYDKKYPIGSKPAFIYETFRCHKLKCNNINKLTQNCNYCNILHQIFN